MTVPFLPTITPAPYTKAETRAVASVMRILKRFDAGQRRWIVETALSNPRLARPRPPREGKRR
jgi:hypothetical protein